MSSGGDAGPVAANPDEVFVQYRDGWYETSTGYWSRQAPTVDGMLGGFRELTGVDAFMSRDLIEKYQNPRAVRGKSRAAPLGNQCVADCGCGIGRVSHFVLADYFKEIDLVDPVESFLSVAVKNLKDDPATVRAFCSGAQDWQPPRSYDAFWIQWAVMYLTDADAVAFLARCKAHLNPNGLIFVKDNLAVAGKDAKKNEAQFFVEDRGICRVYSHYMELFAAAGLTVVEVVKQDGWPPDLLPLSCFVLR
jgi:protein N-terminal methyltransferase